MTLDRTAIGALAVASVIAAGGGAYVAVRQSLQAPPDSEARVAAADTQDAGAAPAKAAVVETEGIIGDLASPATVEPAAGSPAARPPQPQPARTVATSRPDPGDKPRTTGSGARPENPVTAAGAETTAAANDAGLPAGGLDRPWPSRASEEAVAPGAPPEAEPATAAEDAPPVAPEPSETLFEDLVVPMDSVVGLQIERTLTSETARVEDRVQALVTRDIMVGDRIAIPAGSRAEGSVALVERGGKFKERARLGVRFHTLVLANGTRLGLDTETVFRDGTPPSDQSAAKIGGAAVGGAILGAIFGGRKGTVIGGAVGAAGGTAAVAAGDRHAAVLAAGAMLTVRLTSPVTVTVER